MDIWITRCKRTAKCSYCQEPITKTTPMVVGNIWQSKEGKRRFKLRLHWHTSCWIEQGIQSIDREPQVESRGRRKLPISPEDRAKRTKILARRAAVMQRIKDEASKEGVCIDTLTHLGKMLDTLEKEISPLGGVPKSWK